MSWHVTLSSSSSACHCRPSSGSTAPESSAERLSFGTAQAKIPSARVASRHCSCPGGGAEHKFPFVAAVQTDEEGHPQRVQLHRASGFTLIQMRRYDLTFSYGGGENPTDTVSAPEMAGLYA